MQVREHAAGHPIGLVAVGFSPAPALAALADHVGWPGAFLVDADRRLYGLLGMRRARLWQVYSPGTLARYAIAAARGQHLPRPVEDIRQLGGDALLDDGVVVHRWLPRTPDDRVRPARLLRAACNLGTDCSNPGPD
ncbi:MAG: AhpC/TSA family protein [Pseudonocardiaceae bacterium]